MGFFDKIIKGLGFEGEQKQQKQDVKQPLVPDVAHTNGVNAQYDLSKVKEEKKTKVFNPQNQVEVQKIVDELKQEKTVIVNLHNLNANDYVRGLDFLCGALYYGGGKIQKTTDKTYFLTIEN